MAEGDDDWMSEDYQRLSATSAEQFARFDAMRKFDLQRLNNSLNFVGNSHMMSREEYALSVSKSIRYVVPETLKKKREGEEEEEEGECESEHEKKKMKINNDKRPSNKNKLYGDLSPADVFQYYAEKVVYKTIDPKDPIVQAKVANIRKLCAEKTKWLREVYDLTRRD